MAFKQQQPIADQPLIAEPRVPMEVIVGPGSGTEGVELDRPGSRLPFKEPVVWHLGVGWQSVVAVGRPFQ
ncbi:hypothetical protein BLA29_015250 [Euroglyphus maynei]|uniref:Uncharacterized protein n=1 Tax=Euroglyphus maynei TaxID=6958 RepID=A0A1Y3B5Y9_EURMA|nr:hypothetical protein BLA29_015250 [Euroglyphus maynei]